MWYNYLFTLISIVIVLVGVLTGVFLIFLERKVLGYVQVAKGPNKVGYLGLLQPFSDTIKLFTKEQFYPLMSNYLLYYCSWYLICFVSLMIYLVFPLFTSLVYYNLGLLYSFRASRLDVYSVIVSG